MPSIFVSYRRDDTKAVAGRLFDRLGTAFGEKAVFHDVDSIALGSDFRTAISDSLKQCQVCLALIGTKWLAAGQAGDPRIFDPEDWVRVELELALQLAIPIIPILVDGTSMPHTSELPESIASIASYQGLGLQTGPDFGDQVARLTRRLSGLLPIVATAFTDRAAFSDAKLQGSSAKQRSAQALRELYGALVDCHEAYLKHAKDLAHLSPSDRKRVIEAERPEYSESVRRLARTIWHQRFALEVFAPDVFETILAYTDTETGYIGDEGAISLIERRLAPTLGGKDGVQFVEAKSVLKRFIRENVSFHDFL